MYIKFDWKNKPYWECGTRYQCPGNATRGKSSGIPGLGAPGGNISLTSAHTTPDFLTMYEVKGGMSGAAGKGGRGAIAGTPRCAIAARVFWGDGAGPDWYQEYPCYCTVDAPPPDVRAPSYERGATGLVAETSSQCAYLTDALLQKMHEWVSDAFQQDALDDVIATSSLYISSIAECIYSDSAPPPSSSQAVYLQHYKSLFENFLHSIAAHLNYWGRPRGWVPPLAFTAAFQMYAVEVKHATHLLYSAYYLRHRVHDIESITQGLLQTREALQQSVQSNSQQLSAVIERLPSYDGKLSLLNQQADILKQKLKDREDYLEREAQYEADQSAKKRARKARLKKIMRVAGTLMQVIPIGQPVLGAIGSGLCMAESGGFDIHKPIESIQNGAAIYAQLKGVNFGQMAGDVKKGVASSTQSAGTGTGEVGPLQSALLS